jgi:hypothetical protein
MPAVVNDTVYIYRNAQTNADTGYIHVHASPRLTYTSDDYSVANVTPSGRVIAVGGGSTTIHVSASSSSIAIPVTVTARPATDVELTFLDPLDMASRETEGTIFAFPGNTQSTQLRAVVFAGTDTVFCNRCAGFASRSQRYVNFVSRDTTKVKVRNTADPILRTDTTGRLLALDTTTAGQGVYVVLETADGVKDSVLVHIALRPIDSLEVRLDSFADPLDPGDFDPYPTTHIRVDSVVKIGVTFRSKVQDPPDPNTGILPAARFITVTNVDDEDDVEDRGGPVRRAVLPIINWESANPAVASISSAGFITALRWFATNSSQVLSCSATQVVSDAVNGGGVLGGGAFGETIFTGPRLRLPTDPPPPLPPTAADIAATRYTVPGCSPTKTIGMPGAFCTGFGTTTTADPNSVCTVWMRATADDQATDLVLSDKIAITIRRP